jgi:hypothetical protein
MPPQSWRREITRAIALLGGAPGASLGLFLHAIIMTLRLHVFFSPSNGNCPSACDLKNA